MRITLRDKPWQLWVTALLTALLIYSGLRTAEARPPARCQPLQELVTAASHAIHGPRAPAATSGAQLAQESGCNERAVSRVGAQGLAQFMPATAADMAKRFPRHCSPADPFSPVWAVWCQHVYMASLLGQNRDGMTECDRWAFALWAYNGGQGWVNRDKRLAASKGADPSRYLEVAPFNAGRSAANFHENRTYTSRIFALQVRFDAWGRAVCE